MQLTHLVRRSGKAVWLLVLVPVLAVAATVGLLSGDEPPVRTLATVSVIAPDGTATAATITQAVDSFESTVTSETVQSLASQDSGVAIDEGDIVAERVGTSNLVELRLSTEAGEDGRAALTAIVARTNDALYSAPIATSRSRIDTAEKRYQAAVDERTRESSRTGLLLPIEAYRAKASEVTQLRVALATGTAVDREAVQATLKRALEDLGRIGKSVSAFESLEDSVVRTRTELGDAKQAADAVTNLRAAADAPESITITDSVQQSARATLARAVIGAAVVGLALGLGLVLLIGLLRRPGRQARVRAPHDPDGSSPDPEPNRSAAGHRDGHDRDKVLT